ncbi:ATPase/GTPase, AAA15 family [Salinimicrobium catena]|uniref:ATPase/GTPase, AAA15 family n=1 Tax=Salinimicrobium catena TaxID=390640 RepID=A0A1H5N5W4_9FLAO|nr:AAA family ATPase [Salinimicrobium catena]SDL36338.1 ATPase/GTPase, AAA15 family [Salinimicrobium catena]SEE96287.1 ATPase/GTPase, AAA15 family [Salinimicrobium catena]
MEVKVRPHKMIDQEFDLDLSDSKVKVLIGGNGSGKSSILESVFQSPQESPSRIVSYSSGQNESFSKIYQKYQKSNQVYSLDPEEDNTEDEVIDSKFKAVYFDYKFSRLLIFFAVGLNQEGYIIDYFRGKDLSTLKISLDFRIPKSYVDKIENIIKKEALEPGIRTIRNTFFHRYLQIFADRYVKADYDFEKSIEKQNVSFTADSIPIEYSNVTRLFAFLSWAVRNQFIDIDSTEIEIEGLELDSYSDGEFQLMSIYSLLDLFDEENTLFLLDEIDSHIHYNNIKVIWETVRKIKGKLITTTHSADSIILNEFTNLKLVENGAIDKEIVANKVLDRLEALADSANYKLSIAGQIKNIALVEDYFDWFIFLELCKRKIEDFDLNVQEQIHYIKCSSGFNSYAERFGGPKLDWVEAFRKQHTNPQTANIFLLCDRDNLSIRDVTDTGLVINSAPMGRQSRIRLRGNGNKHAYLMSWKRREIENYLLSFTMLSKHDKLDEINKHLPPLYQLKPGDPADNDNVRELDTKKLLQPLYLKDNISSMPTNDGGVDYNKLAAIIAEIPRDEISVDIENVYKFLKGKI